MLRTGFLIGGAFAAFALAAFSLVLAAPVLTELLSFAQSERPIAPGFIGVANFGEWRLVCIPGPPTLDGLAEAAPAPQTQPVGNSCRINQEMPAPNQEPGQGGTPLPNGRRVIIATNFSLVGETRTPAALIRLPATAEPGDVITLSFDNDAEIKTMVRDCSSECVATATFSGAEWARLSTARSLRVTFPLAGRQWVVLNLPVAGLSEAIAAMDRAEKSMSE